MKRRASKVQRAVEKLRRAADSRELFSRLISTAHLWPKYCLWPEQGNVRRVVFFSHAFNDRIIGLLEQVHSVHERIEGLEEIRLVATKISHKKVVRLRKLMPEVEIRVVPDEEWEANVECANPAYNMKEQRLEPAGQVESERASIPDLEALLRTRYGKS